ncbi:MAG: late competence development ComFB family protein [Thermoanaerobacteraceae bacterium]|nr:late competence development ComFB family protein [Thermoanaerobacteraceae bacterium]
MGKTYIKNYMEDIVWELLPDILNRFPECCNCEICRHDIVAKALNDLPPKYVARHKGEVYTKVAELTQQFRTDVYSALTKAILVVSQNPNH